MLEYKFYLIKKKKKNQPSYFAFPYTQNKCIKFCGRREENRGVEKLWSVAGKGKYKKKK